MAATGHPLLYPPECLPIYTVPWWVTEQRHRAGAALRPQLFPDHVCRWTEAPPSGAREHLALPSARRRAFFLRAQSSLMIASGSACPGGNSPAAFEPPAARSHQQDAAATCSTQPSVSPGCSLGKAICAPRRGSEKVLPNTLLHLHTCLYTRGHTGVELARARSVPRGRPRGGQQSKDFWPPSSRAA